MSDGPKVVYTRIAAGDPDRARRWLAAVSQLHRVGDEVAIPWQRPDTGDVTVWHLASRNHRTLARGACLYGSRDDAVAAVGQITASAPELVVRLVARRHPGSYGWYATLNGNVAFTAARWFDSERSRRESIELAFAAIGRLSHV
ncbi:MAG TPA: hypothetical protein VNT53_03065 [Pseudolysinimonas sp.]|nr:hypothetical protein [Pseudolysinimonas sp.]